MHALDRTAWEVLNATADDCENLEQIYHLVCFEYDAEGDLPGQGVYRPVRGAPFLSDIADRVRALVEAGLLRPVMDENGEPLSGTADLGYVWRAWFVMTPRGRSVWESSEHAQA
jgi:hypothetical protein